MNTTNFTNVGVLCVGINTKYMYTLSQAGNKDLPAIRFAIGRSD